jgi:hypothetical protein
MKAEIVSSIEDTAQPLVDQAEAWAEGTLPGGAGTKSAKEHAEDAAATATYTKTVLPIYDQLEQTEKVPLYTDDRLRVPMDYEPGTGSIGISVAEIGQLTSAGISGYTNDPDFSEAYVLWVDEDDRVLFALTSESAGSTAAIGGLKAVLGASDPDLRVSQGIAHIITNGQSLSTARGVLYPVQSSEDWTFSGGVDFRVEDTASTLIPMFNEGVAGIGWDAVQQSKAMMLDGDPLYVRWPMLLSSHGFGGQFITTLSKGGSTGSYEDMMWGVTEGKRLADAAGTSYAVRALIWAQGESERNQTQAYYQTNFGAYLADLRADVAAITAQDAPIHILTHQPSGNQYESSPGSRYENTVALATSAMHEADPLIIPACPTYWVPHADELHPTPEGSALIGAMMGKVLYHVAFRGEAWKPLYPRKIRFATPRICIIQFDVPVAPIVLDTEWVSNPGDFGFVVEDAGGVCDITGVRVIGADTVEITLAANIGASPVVSYAAYGVGGTGGGPITGARGCLRDSDPALSLLGDHLWNPCLTFKKSAPWERV